MKRTSAKANEWMKRQNNLKWKKGDERAMMEEKIKIDWKLDEERGTWNLDQQQDFGGQKAYYTQHKKGKSGGRSVMVGRAKNILDKNQ